MNSMKIIKLLKNKYWENGMFYDSKLKHKKAVCFHSRDIRKHNNCFNDSIINYIEFMTDLTNTMKNSIIYEIHAYKSPKDKISFKKIK